VPGGRIEVNFRGQTPLAVSDPLGQFEPVNDDAFKDTVLVVLGHGTESNDQSAAPVRQHVAELRRRRIFREVRDAFWKQEPLIKNVLAQVSAPRVFIVPLFISEGYFAGETIPRALGFGASRTVQYASGTTFYCQPIGTHESMTKVILARAAEVTRQFPFPRVPKPAETTLFIAGHGTEKNGKSRQPIDRQVEVIRAQKIYADVQAVFMEEEPCLAGCHKFARTRNCIVVPFFISDGLHVVEDIPVLLGETESAVKARLIAGRPTWRNPTEIHGKLFWYSSSVGTEPGIAEVILDRVRESSGTAER
jgi:sirohydrochlorin cobaltochelatase